MLSCHPPGRGEKDLSWGIFSKAMSGIVPDHKSTLANSSYTTHSKSCGKRRSCRVKGDGRQSGECMNQCLNKGTPALSRNSNILMSPIPWHWFHKRSNINHVLGADFLRVVPLSLCALRQAKWDFKRHPLRLGVKYSPRSGQQHSIKQHFSWSAPSIVAVFKGNNGSTDLYCASCYRWRWSVCRDYQRCTEQPRGQQSLPQPRRTVPGRSGMSSSQIPVAAFDFH